MSPFQHEEVFELDDGGECNSKSKKRIAGYCLGSKKGADEIKGWLRHVMAVAVGVVSILFGIGVPIYYESQIDNVVVAVAVAVGGASVAFGIVYQFSTNRRLTMMHNMDFVDLKDL